MFSKNLTRLVGDRYERQAANYLVAKGLTLVKSNFYSRFGEIDLIMLDGDCWVFVEVKYRKQQTFGGAVAAVTPTKLNRLRKTVEVYLQKQNLNSNLVSYRIDLLAFDNEDIEWIQSIG